MRDEDDRERGRPGEGIGTTEEMGITGEMGTCTSTCPLPGRIAANKRRVLQAAGSSRRHLFDAERKAVFLDWFTGTANLSWAARKAGVHYRTVLRHRAEDAGFAAAYDLADAQAVPRLRAWLAEAKAEEAGRLKGAALGGEGTVTSNCPHEIGGEIAPARLNVEQAMQFLRDFEQSRARRGSGPGAAGGRAPGGHGRPVGVASNEEVREALVRALKAHGIRVRSAETGAGDDLQGPLHQAPPGPPPRSGEEE